MFEIQGQIIMMDKILFMICLGLVIIFSFAFGYWLRIWDERQQLRQNEHIKGSMPGEFDGLRPAKDEVVHLKEEPRLNMRPDEPPSLGEDLSYLREQVRSVQGEYEQLKGQLAEMAMRVQSFGELESMHGFIGDERYHYVTYDRETWYNVLRNFEKANPDHIAYVIAWRAAIDKGFNPMDILGIFGTLILGKRPNPLDLNGDGQAQTPTGEETVTSWGTPEEPESWPDNPHLQH